jgi:hypothetical protein
MSFPVAPTNLQQATVNNIVYQYSSSINAWTRVPAGVVLAGTATLGNVITTAGVFWSNGAAFSPVSTKTLSVALNSGSIANVSLTTGYIAVLNNSGGTVNIATY